MTAACVCSSNKHWRCGLHGTITPAMRAAARQGRTPALGQAETNHETLREVSRGGAPVASHPDQLTIHLFPQWDGTLPVPYDVVPY